ncbi:MAG: hypothetical protein JRJ46_06490 [Deltaproteobacteria bacterium]|nr:hypothetical protein [Deltaproteobacteria bacterium]
MPRKITEAYQRRLDEIFITLMEEEYDNCGLLILDNLSALSSGLDHSAGADYEPIRDWLLKLKNYERAVIIFHHPKKSDPKEQLGTSTREANTDTGLILSEVQGADKSLGALFKVEQGKNRSTGYFPPFTMLCRREQNESGSYSAKIRIFPNMCSSTGL